MRELEEEVKRTIPPSRAEPSVERALVASQITSSGESKSSAKGLVPTLGLVAALVVGGVVAWYVVKHVIVTLFWIAALGVLGWFGWKYWRKKKRKENSKR